MITVILPSKIAAKLVLLPVRMAPSKVLPALSSSLMRSLVIILASTPIPMERITPAMPGKVRVKLGTKLKKPETQARDKATCPSRAMQATKPGTLYTININRQTSTKAIAPAKAIAFRAEAPRVGLMVLRFVVSSLKGKAPA